MLIKYLCFYKCSIADIVRVTMGTNNCNRYVVVAMGCLLLIVSGGLGSLISIENDLKKRLHISQKQSKR